MPNGGRTVPLGWKPMTWCAARYFPGPRIPAYRNVPSERGFWQGGRGRCGGRGRGCWLRVAGFTGWPQVFMPRPAIAWRWAVGPRGLAFFPGFAGVMPQLEINALKGQLEYLEGLLHGIRRRIEELTPKPSQV